MINALCPASIVSFSDSLALASLASLDFSIFELIMLVCWGICWPVSVFKSLKSKRTEGKSLLFMVIVWFGYVSGVTYKLVDNYDLVIILYIFNLILVSIDIALYLKYSQRIAPAPGTLD